MNNIPPDPICHVCRQHSAKYRCPTCRLRYCGLDCWKTHKQQPCEKKKDDKPRLPKRKIEREDIPSTLTQQQLRQLEDNENIRRAVGDRRLQEVIDQILNDPDPVKTAKKIMRNHPEFAEFADVCLRSVGVRDAEGNCLL